MLSTKERKAVFVRRISFNKENILVAYDSTRMVESVKINYL